MSRFRTEVLSWFEAGRIVAGREEQALRAAGMMPAPTEWRSFFGQLTLWLGTVALAAALIFFFAFNWDDLSRFAKFGMVEAAIVAGLLVCWRIDLDSMAGKAVLLLLSLLTGALLALAGQIYQTGADTFELFLYWAILILPWVLVGRFTPLWLVWLGLLNLAASQYFGLFREVEPLLWALFLLNACFLILWEAGHRAGLAWLRDSWPPRLIAVAAAIMATMLVVAAILDRPDIAILRPLAILAYVAWIGALYHWYRSVRPDLFMLAGLVLSLVVVTVALLIEYVGSGDSGELLLIGLVVILMSAGGAMWLKSVARDLAARDRTAGGQGE